MDTTYFGRTFGIMVFKDSITGQILFKQYVKQETNKLYLFGIEEITRRGIKIQNTSYYLRWPQRVIAIIRRYPYPNV